MEIPGASKVDPASAFLMSRVRASAGDGARDGISN